MSETATAVELSDRADRREEPARPAGSEATVDKRARDRARLKRIAVRHGAAALAAITLFGAADLWASQSSLGLATVVAVLDAIFVGVVLAYLAHEWGHFSGARLSGARSPVLKEPRSFFMFGFDTPRNTLSQFLSMSVGGPVANWSLVLLIAVALPLDTVAQAALLAAAVAIAVDVCVFEVPVIRDAMSGRDPATTIAARQRALDGRTRYEGTAVGVAVWLLMVAFVV